MPVVSGRVADPEGKPIADALVSLDSYWDNSNSGGRYELEVPIGVHALRAVRRGFKTVSREIEVDGDMTVDITMVPG